jgi:hypothetical protein
VPASNCALIYDIGADIPEERKLTRRAIDATVSFAAAKGNPDGESDNEELDDALRSCASRFCPKATEKMFPANMGDMDRYPQFSEKCAVRK